MFFSHAASIERDFIKKMILMEMIKDSSTMISFTQICNLQVIKSKN